MKLSPRSAISLIRQQIPHLLPPPTLPPVLSSSPPSPPTPSLPPTHFSMASAIKLLVFKGVGNEDLDQIWFVVKAVWEAHGVTDENIKKETLVSTLEDRALTWYIKKSNDNPNAGIAEIQAALNREFSRIKLEMQSIIGFKEIRMLLGETPWELHQRLKGMTSEANMTLMDAKHRTWFVASLMSHLRMTLSQQKLSTQAEVLEITMRLHETPIQDPGLGVQQIHTQMKTLCLEMQSLK